jgi:hypothetical protein
MMMPPFDYSSKEMMKFLALYQALKTIDVMTEEESNSEEENGESCDCEEDSKGMCKCKKAMMMKMKVASKSSYGQYRKMGTRK